MSPASAVISITEERTYSAKLGDRTVTGLAVSSAWEGFTKFTDRAGAHLIVLDAEQRVITGAPELLAQLTPRTAAKAMPSVGDKFEGGIYAGLTELDGKLAHLILLPGQIVDATWSAAAAWAAEANGSLPTRKEQITLFENLKSEFDERWYWSGQQHASNPSCAWGQFFSGGGQDYGRKGNEGRARAVRRLPI